MEVCDTEATETETETEKERERAWWQLQGQYSIHVSKHAIECATEDSLITVFKSIT